MIQILTELHVTKEPYLHLGMMSSTLKVFIKIDFLNYFFNIDFDYNLESDEEKLIKKQIEFHLQRKEITRKSLKGNSDKKTAWSENIYQPTEREVENSSECKSLFVIVI